MLKVSCFESLFKITTLLIKGELVDAHLKSAAVDHAPLHLSSHLISNKIYKDIPAAEAVILILSICPSRVKSELVIVTL